MSKPVSRMTREELAKLITSTVEVAVEQKLTEFLGDPDAGLSLRKRVRAQLLRQKRAVARGQRGRPLGELLKHLGLE